MSVNYAYWRGFFPFRTKTHYGTHKHTARTRRAVVEQLEKRDLLAVVVPDSVLSIGGPVNDSGFSVAVNAAGDHYLTGGFRGSVDFDPVAATTSLISDGPNRDIFVAKYLDDGTLDWARRFGAAGPDNEWLDGEAQVDAAANTPSAGSPDPTLRRRSTSTGS